MKQTTVGVFITDCRIAIYTVSVVKLSRNRQNDTECVHVTITLTALTAKQTFTNKPSPNRYGIVKRLWPGVGMGGSA